MGVQVGNVCYATRKEAENVYFSQVTPKISDDGKLIQLKSTPVGWILNGYEVKADLPHCDPMNNMRDGAYIGWSVVAIMAAIWGIRLIWQKLR